MDSVLLLANSKEGMYFYLKNLEVVADILFGGTRISGKLFQ